MVTWDEVRRIALDLPQVTERDGENPSWRVRQKLVAWERPLRENDLAYLGESAPTGPILGVRVADLNVKGELLAVERPILFTTPHFNGYPIVLVDLDRAPIDLVEELIVEAWLVQAPTRIANAWLGD